MAHLAPPQARAVLPPSLPYEDAVFNISRAAMLVNCFATAQVGGFSTARRTRKAPRPVCRSLFPTLG